MREFLLWIHYSFDKSWISFSTGVMSKKKEGIQREKERLQGEVVQLSQKLQNALGYQEELEHKNSAADIKITELSTQVEVRVQ